MVTALLAGLCARIERSSEESGFSGVVSLGQLGQRPWLFARGFADRARGELNTPETQLALASGTKTLTALAVMSLVAEGKLALDSDLQELLGADRDVVQPGVTVRQLLAHSSGIGDYLGFWLSRAHRVVFMEGLDAGISFRSTFEPATGLVCTVLSNTTRGAWPLVSVLEAALGALAEGKGSAADEVNGMSS